MKNSAFNNLLSWRMTILPILTTPFIYFSWKGCENAHFELGSERIPTCVSTGYCRCLVSVVSQIGVSTYQGDNTICSTIYNILNLYQHWINMNFPRISLVGTICLGKLPKNELSIKYFNT